jgi:hypothetical protein
LIAVTLRYLLDENQRGLLWQVIQRHNTRQLDPLDALCVGDLPELPLGAEDPDILMWAEAHERILVTFDKSTMPGHLSDHLAGGHHCPGIFMVRRTMRPLAALEFLVLAAYASEPAEWRDRIKYLDD